MLRFLSTAVVLLTTSGDGDYSATLELHSANIEVTVQQPVSEDKAREIVEWVRVNATHVEDVYGRFPSKSAQVIVVTRSRRGRGGGDAVQFGQVTRNNGGTVTLYVNTDRPIAEFYSDWTATHEFSHLMMPLLDRSYRWITEGLATYYQNVLMARGGQYTEEFAWQRLREGFERGRQSDPDVSPNQAAADGRRGARMKIYWSGAAVALLADVELRRRSGGRESLDSVLGELHSCCLPTQRRWSGPRLMRQLDSFIDEPLFVPLYEQYADANGFPEVEGTLHRLGVAGMADSIEFVSNADLAEIRAAIMTGDNKH